MKNSKYEFNKLFYKTIYFWLGLILAMGTVGKFILYLDFSKLSWLPIIVAIILLFIAFFRKKAE